MGDLRFESYVWRNGASKSVAEIARITGKSRQEVIDAYDSALLKQKNKKLVSPDLTPWTDDEVEEIARMFDAGATERQIAIAMGRSENSVAGKIRRLRNHGMIKRPKYVCKKWSDQEEQKMLEMYQSNVATKDIAETLGRTETAIIAKLKVIRERLYSQGVVEK